MTPLDFDKDGALMQVDPLGTIFCLSFSPHFEIKTSDHKAKAFVIVIVFVESEGNKLQEAEIRAICPQF